MLLHEGVSDRRGWRQVAEYLAPLTAVVAYDRRGYGESAVSTASFTNVSDLLAVLGQQEAGRAWLVGASAGGDLALDTALLAPDRVAGLVLIGTAVSGAPEPELDPDTLRFDALIDAAIATGNLDEVNRLETWLWLDGPSVPEGRVGGEARELVLDMNAIILRNGARESEGDSEPDAWHRLDEVRVPVTVACGELDVQSSRPLLWRWREAGSSVPRVGRAAQNRRSGYAGCPTSTHTLARLPSRPRHSRSGWSDSAQRVGDGLRPATVRRGAASFTGAV